MWIISQSRSKKGSECNCILGKFFNEFTYSAIILIHSLLKGDCISTIPIDLHFNLCYFLIFNRIWSNSWPTINLPFLFFNFFFKCHIIALGNFAVYWINCDSIPVNLPANDYKIYSLDMSEEDDVTEIYSEIIKWWNLKK